MPIPFDNTYARLPEGFYAKLHPTPVRAPGLIRVNHALAAELGLDPLELESEAGVAMFAGNRVPKGALPLAQAYAGHQFGGFSPRLGDGRAILLGEVVDGSGVRQDIQLKGSGPTPFSRGGDGRAWLGPVLREYLLSEAMHALRVPTTRALAAVTTGEDVYREGLMPGAVFTRVASSHIRVGTFQFFAAQQDAESLRTLFDYAVARHDPGVGEPLEWLRAVIQRQASLVAKWMGIGFIHGVMNTDNCAVSGETIDYGPCAFMDTYHPLKVFSSIDRGGRYAFSRQPQIMVWNMAQLASALLPLIDADEDSAVAAATAVVQEAPEAMHRAWLDAFRGKLGLVGLGDSEDHAKADSELVESLLQVMQDGEADFTNFFRALPDPEAAKACFGKASDESLAAMDRWFETWTERLGQQGQEPLSLATKLRQHNPAIIPRNHRVEEAIQAGVQGDLSVFENLLTAWSDPWSDRPPKDHLTLPPAPHEVVTATFCGT